MIRPSETRVKIVTTKKVLRPEPKKILSSKEIRENLQSLRETISSKFDKKRFSLKSLKNLSQETGTRDLQIDNKLPSSQHTIEQYLEMKKCRK